MARICSLYISIHKTSLSAGDRVTVSRASANVQLTITSLCLRLADLDTGRALHQVGVLLELETKVREDFTITEKAPTRAFSWLKVSISAFTFKTLC